MEKEISEVKIYSKSLRKCIWKKRASSKNVREQRGATEVSEVQRREGSWERYGCFYTQNNMITNGPRLHRGFHRMDAAQGLWRTF